MIEKEEKYLGESKLSDKPKKKINLVLSDKAVTTPKLADKAVTPSKLSDDVVSEVIQPIVNRAASNLQNQINSLTVSGMAVSNEFGDNPNIAISQQTLTEALNNVWAKIGEQESANNVDLLYFTDYIESVDPEQYITIPYSGEGGEITYVTGDNLFALHVGSSYYLAWESTDTRAGSEMYNKVENDEYVMRDDKLYYYMVNSDSGDVYVDDELDAESTNPISNKAVSQAFSDRAPLSGTITISSVSEDNVFRGTCTITLSDVMEAFDAGRRIILIENTLFKKKFAVSQVPSIAEDAATCIAIADGDIYEITFNVSSGPNIVKLIKRNNTAVDATLNSTSTNPVQNKVVTENLTDIRNTVNDINEVVSILSNTEAGTKLLPIDSISSNLINIQYNGAAFATYNGDGGEIVLNTSSKRVLLKVIEGSTKYYAVWSSRENRYGSDAYADLNSTILWKIEDGNLYLYRYEISNGSGTLTELTAGQQASYKILEITGIITSSTVSIRASEYTGSEGALWYINSPNVHKLVWRVDNSFYDQWTNNGHPSSAECANADLLYIEDLDMLYIYKRTPNGLIGIGVDNIKTINGQSLSGTGNITIPTGIKALQIDGIENGIVTLSVDPEPGGEIIYNTTHKRFYYKNGNDYYSPWHIDDVPTELEYRRADFVYIIDDYLYLYKVTPNGLVESSASVSEPSGNGKALLITYAGDYQEREGEWQAGDLYLDTSTGKLYRCDTDNGIPDQPYTPESGTFFCTLEPDTRFYYYDNQVGGTLTSVVPESVMSDTTVRNRSLENAEAIETLKAQMQNITNTMRDYMDIISAIPTETPGEPGEEPGTVEPSTPIITPINTRVFDPVTGTLGSYDSSLLEADPEDITVADVDSSIDDLTDLDDGLDVETSIPEGDDKYILTSSGAGFVEGDMNTSITVDGTTTTVGKYNASLLAAITKKDGDYANCAGLKLTAKYNLDLYSYASAAWAKSPKNPLNLISSTGKYVASGIYHWYIELQKDFTIYSDLGSDDLPEGGFYSNHYLFYTKHSLNLRNIVIDYARGGGKLNLINPINTGGIQQLQVVGCRFPNSKGEPAKCAAIYIVGNDISPVDSFEVPCNNNFIEHIYLHDNYVDGSYLLWCSGGCRTTKSFRITGNTIVNCGVGIDVSTANDKEFNTQINYMACPLFVAGNTFKGLQKIRWTTASSQYYCAVIVELGTIYMLHNTIEDFISGRIYSRETRELENGTPVSGYTWADCQDSSHAYATYDLYANSTQIYFCNNIVKDLARMSTGQGDVGTLKAKGRCVPRKYKNNHKKVERIYRNNQYLVTSDALGKVASWWPTFIDEVEESAPVKTTVKDSKGNVKYIKTETPLMDSAEVSAVTSNFSDYFAFHIGQTLCRSSSDARSAGSAAKEDTGFFSGDPTIIYDTIFDGNTVTYPVIHTQDTGSNLASTNIYLTNNTFSVRKVFKSSLPILSTLARNIYITDNDFSYLDAATIYLLFMKHYSYYKTPDQSAWTELNEDGQKVDANYYNVDNQPTNVILAGNIFHSNVSRIYGKDIFHAKYDRDVDSVWKYDEEGNPSLNIGLVTIGNKNGKVVELVNEESESSSQEVDYAPSVQNVSTVSTYGDLPKDVVADTIVKVTLPETKYYVCKNQGTYACNNFIFRSGADNGIIDLTFNNSVYNVPIGGGDILEFRLNGYYHHHHDIMNAFVAALEAKGYANSEINVRLGDSGYGYICFRAHEPGASNWVITSAKTFTETDGDKLKSIVLENSQYTIQFHRTSLWKESGFIPSVGSDPVWEETNVQEITTPGTVSGGFGIG